METLTAVLLLRTRPCTFSTFGTAEHTHQMDEKGEVVFALDISSTGIVKSALEKAGPTGKAQDNGIKNFNMYADVFLSDEIIKIQFITDSLL